MLNDSTNGENFDSTSVNYYSENIPGLEPETIYDYINANKSKTKLKKISGVNFIFASEYNNNQKKVDVSLSRVGYNKLRTQAIVTMGALYAPLDGIGKLFFLVKSGSKWIINKSIMTWIS